MGSSQVMGAFAFVLLVAAAKAEADAEAYTVGQVAHGLTAGGVVTGVDYGHGLVSGVGAVGNRAVYAAAPAVHHVATPAVYSAVHHAAPAVYSGLNSVYRHYYGKREAEAEPEAEADPLVYTTGVHAPVVSTYSHGVVAAPAVSSVVSPVVRTVASPVVSLVAAPVVRTVASPVVSHVATPAVYSGYHAGVYSGLSSVYGHYYGKREAEAEPEAYTIGQVHAGLPLVNAYATGHPHNVGYTTNVGYTHYPYAHYGYGYTGHYYG